MADQLSVDLGGLEQWAGSLDQVHSGFDGTGKTIDAYHGKLGRASVETALHDFDQAWAKGRGVIDSYFAALSKMARDSVTLIQQGDKQLADVVPTAH